MSNIKGDVALGDYTLRMDFNALCDAEEDFPGIMQGQVSLDSFRNIRSMVRHALAAHHPDLDDRAVGDIIHEVGLEAAALAITDAMQASFGSSEASETANPQKAPAKTGTGTRR